jgi:site-specific DNA recombinase
MMATKPQRAAIYVRISDDREGREVGVHQQEQDCRELAETLGWTLHPNPPHPTVRNRKTQTGPVYNDNDRGASTLSRKRRHEFEALIEAVRCGQVDAVVYYSNSRLTRRPLEYAAIEELVKETGVRLASVKSGHVDLTTADGRMVGGILARIDQAEAERIGERVARRWQGRRESGQAHSTGMRPFGFAPDGVTPDPAEAAAIRDAAREMLRGASLGDIARSWTETGIKPPTGGRWSRTTVRRALTRPRVAGLIEHLGEVVGTIGTDKAGNRVEGTPDPILTRETWEAVRAAAAKRSGEVRARYHGREHLLSGLLSCGVCGGPMKISARRDEDGNVRADSFASCVKENGGCGHVKRNLRLLESFVLAAVEHRLTETIPFAEDDPHDPDGVERARLAAELEAAEGKISDLRTAYETTDLAAVDFVPMIGRLRNRKAELEAALGELPEQHRPTNLGDDPLADWRAGDFDDRRKVLEALVESVVVEPIGKVGPTRARAMVESTTKILWS